MTATTAAYPGLASPGLALPGSTDTDTTITITVNNTIVDPDLTPATGLTVTALPTGANPWLPDGREVLRTAVTATTDDTGLWTMNLVPGDYRIREGSGTYWRITVPATGGPYNLEDILTS